jgi:hypothetical protein
MGSRGHTGRKIAEILLDPLHGRTSENTMPTRFEDFAEKLARSYEEASG